MLECLRVVRILSDPYARVKLSTERKGQKMTYPTATEMYAMNNQELWDWMLTQPNYFIDSDGMMDCDENCEHLEMCMMCG